MINVIGPANGLMCVFCMQLHTNTSQYPSIPNPPILYYIHIHTSRHTKNASSFHYYLINQTKMWQEHVFRVLMKSGIGEGDIVIANVGLHFHVKRVT